MANQIDLIDNLIADEINNTFKITKEITAKELFDRGITEITCLVEPIFPKVGIACLIGSSDTGKSTLLRQLSISIVKGQSDFIGFKLNAEYKSVIYVSTEDEENATSFILNKQCLDNVYLENLRFIFEIDSIPDELRISLSNQPADLVIIDAFGDVFRQDLKDSTKLRGLLSEYQKISREYNCLILFLHHTVKKSEYSEPSKNNSLSGQGFEAKLRIMVELRQDTNDSSLKHFCIVKGNYLGSDFKNSSYVLKFDSNSFQFTNTGERTPFEHLAKSFITDEGKAKFIRATELKRQGKKHEEVAQIMGFSDKGNISKILSKGKDKGWDKELGFQTGHTGNDQETD